MSTTNFTLRRNPSAWLLAVQLLGFLLYPLMETSPSGRALFGAFGLVVLGAALWVVRRSPWLTWLGLLLALPVVVLSVIVVVSPGPQLLVWTAALESLFYFYAAGSLIAYMLQDWVATTDELFAAGATFTLLAWAFGYAYVVCEAVLPGSFVAAGSATAARTWMELLYLSVAVLSSVGLSDIVPVTPMARAIVMLESVTGVMYIAFVVSSLISVQYEKTRRDRRRSASGNRAVAGCRLDGSNLGLRLQERRERVAAYLHAWTPGCHAGGRPSGELMSRQASY